MIDIFDLQKSGIGRVGCVDDEDDAQRGLVGAAVDRLAGGDEDCEPDLALLASVGIEEPVAVRHQAEPIVASRLVPMTAGRRL
jgi:hypothetical protein